MFKKTLVFFAITTFSVCSLSAQNTNDKTQKTEPKTDSVPTNTKTTTDTTKASAFVMNNENLRSINAQMTDSVPTKDSSMKTDTTKSMAFVMNHENLKSVSENNSEKPDQLVVYANVSKKLNKISISDK